MAIWSLVHSYRANCGVAFAEPSIAFCSVEMALTNCRRLTPLLRQASAVRNMSTSTFADMYRDSVSSIPVKPGDMLVGHVVGQQRPRSASSQFSIVDFGLKSEAPFAKGETPGVSGVGDAVTRTVVELEDDFNEPAFDLDQRFELPAVLAQRYRALTSASSEQPQFFYGRLTAFKRGGASTKVLGFDAFSPRHHVLAIQSPAVGSHSPLYLLSMATSKRTSGYGPSLPGLDVNPVVSSYGGIMFTLANLVGFDDAWAASGGGSSKERLAYLRLLTRVLFQKNAAVRRAMPKGNVPSSRPRAPPAQNTRKEGHVNPLRYLASPDFPGVWRQGPRGMAVARDRKQNPRKQAIAPRPGSRPFEKSQGIPSRQSAKLRDGANDPESDA